MTPFVHAEREFQSLSECIDFARFENRDGRYLFRGERTDQYSETRPMHDRVQADTRLPAKVRNELPEITDRLRRDLCDFLAIGPDLAFGFLQHYEMPTRMLDLTSSVEVAAAFASDGDQGNHGLLALVPRTIAEAGTLVNLTQHPRAVRPRRQYAFTFTSSVVPNLKDQNALATFGIRWLRFRHSKAETEKFAAYYRALMDAGTDVVVGIIQLLLDDYGKWNDWTADWLAYHVACGPVVAHIIGRDQDGSLVVELTVPDEAGLELDEAAERANNRRIWSNAYPDQRGTGGFVSLRHIPRAC